MRNKIKEIFFYLKNQTVYKVVIIAVEFLTVA